MVDGKVSYYDGVYFTYSGNRLVCLGDEREKHYITWTGDKPTRWDVYYKDCLDYFSDMTYNDRCPDAAIAFAIDLCAGHFADPEGADMIVVLYALAPYLGTLTNELVGNVTATEGEEDDTEKDFYDCNYTYVKDGDGYPTEVHIDVKHDYWHNGNTKTYTHQRVIYLEWEGTAGMNPALTISQQEDAWYDLSGRRVEHPTKGVFISKGKKVVR